MGAGIADVVTLTRACKACGDFVPDGTTRDVPVVGYRDLDGLVVAARRLAGRLFDDAGVCARCGRKSAVVFVDHHAWHAAMGRDLVVRVHRRLFAVETELLWWSSSSGYLPATPTERQRHQVRRDAVFRAVRVTMNRAGLRASRPRIEEAAQLFRGDVDLLGLVPALLGAGWTDLVGQSPPPTSRSTPTTADGWFWLAMAVRANVERGALARAHFAQVESHLWRALALRPDFPEADCALCQVTRARGDRGAARRCLERALHKYPDHARLRIDLARLELDRDPAACPR